MKSNSSKFDSRRSKPMRIILSGEIIYHILIQNKDFLIPFPGVNIDFEVDYEILNSFSETFSKDKNYWFYFKNKTQDWTFLCMKEKIIIWIIG